MNDNMDGEEQEEQQQQQRTSGFRAGLVRGLCLFIGLFTLINLLGELWVPGFNANDWWIDFRPMPQWVRMAVLLPMSVLLVALGIYRYGGIIRHTLTFAWV